MLRQSLKHDSKMPAETFFDDRHERNRKLSTERKMRVIVANGMRINTRVFVFDDPSSPKPGHTTGGSGRHSAGRTAGRGDAGQNKVPTFRWPWKPTAPLALQRTVKTVLNVSSQARTRGKKFKPVEERNQPLTRGLSAVYHQDRKRSTLQAVDQCTDAFLSLCKPFFM